MIRIEFIDKVEIIDEKNSYIEELNYKDVGRLRFELRTSRLKAGCSTTELATHYVKLSTLKIIPFKGKKNNLLF